MSKPVSVSTLGIRLEYLGEYDRTDIVTTTVYDDGRVLQQYGSGEDWVQIKDPDEWVPVPGEGDPDEIEDPEVKTQKGLCGACNQLFKPGELTVFSATGKICHRLAKECGQ